MKHSLLAITVLSFVGGALAQEPEQFQKALAAHLGTAIEWQAPSVVRYCPDSTCEVFRMQEPAAQRLLDGFALLYLFYESNYSYLASFRSAASADVAAIQKTLAHFCEAQQASPKCILDSMQEKLDITVSFGRYDEGAYVEVPQ